jgi:hypothetical protein
MIWSVDAELDEILADATNTLNGNDDGTLSSNNIASHLVKTKKAKQNVEHDKETIRAVVKKLLVRSAVCAPQLPTHNLVAGLQHRKSRILSGTLRYCRFSKRGSNFG